MYLLLIFFSVVSLIIEICFLLLLYKWTLLLFDMCISFYSFLLQLGELLWESVIKLIESLWESVVKLIESLYKSVAKLIESSYKLVVRLIELLWESVSKLSKLLCKSLSKLIELLCELCNNKIPIDGDILDKTRFNDNPDTIKVLQARGTGDGSLSQIVTPRLLSDVESLDNGWHVIDSAKIIKLNNNLVVLKLDEPANVDTKLKLTRALTNLYEEGNRKRICVTCLTDPAAREHIDAYKAHAGLQGRWDLHLNPRFFKKFANFR